MRDGEDETKNPYRYECSKHGGGYGPIDECPICMEQDYLEDLAHESDELYCNICGKMLTIYNDEGDGGFHGRYSIVSEFGGIGEWNKEESFESFCDSCCDKVQGFIKELIKNRNNT